MATVDPVVRMERRVPRQIYVAALLMVLCRAFDDPARWQDTCLLVCHGTGERKGVRALLSADRAGRSEEVGDGRENAT